MYRNVILDLSNLASEKEIYSYTVKFEDRGDPGVIRIVDSGTFDMERWTDEVGLDNEYIVYIDLYTKRIYCRYVEVGIVRFNYNQLLISRFLPTFPWGLFKDNMFNNVIVELFTYNGNKYVEYKFNVYNRTQVYSEELDNSAMICYYDQFEYNYIGVNEVVQVNYSNFNIYFQMMGIEILIDGGDLPENRLIVNRRFTEEYMLGRYDNTDAVNSGQHWYVLVLLSDYNPEFDLINVSIHIMSSMYITSRSGMKLYGAPASFQQNFTEDDIAGEVSLFSDMWAEIHYEDLNDADNWRSVWNSQDNRVVEYVKYIFLSKNVIYKYINLQENNA